MTKNYYTIDKDQLIKDLEKIHYSTGAMEETKSLINEIGNLSPRSPLIIAVNLLKEIRDALNKRLGDDALIEISLVRNSFTIRATWVYPNLCTATEIDLLTLESGKFDPDMLIRGFAARANNERSKELGE